MDAFEKRLNQMIKETEENTLAELKKHIGEGKLSDENVIGFYNILTHLFGEKEYERVVEICEVVFGYYEITTARMEYEEFGGQHFAFLFGKITGMADMLMHVSNREIEKKEFEQISETDTEIMEYIHARGSAFGANITHNFGNGSQRRLRRLEENEYVNIRKVQRNNIYTLTLKGDRYIAFRKESKNAD